MLVFTTGAGSWITALALQPDAEDHPRRRMFTQLGEVTRNYIGRLHP